MNRKERVIIAFVLFVIALLSGFDLYTDAHEGAVPSHLLTEGAIATIAFIGVFLILRGTVQLNVRLESSKTEIEKLKKTIDQWKVDSRKYVDGLSKAIDHQLSTWNLTSAEKEVAFLLLKGMSLKEVAEIRNTAEKTARVQSMAIYSKSGLAGRSELSAFFLEDLLLPNENRDKLQEL